MLDPPYFGGPHFFFSHLFASFRIFSDLFTPSGHETFPAPEIKLISDELSRCRRNPPIFAPLARPNPAMGCLFIEDSEITIYGVQARLAWSRFVAPNRG
jgi:hypothetical protein